MEKVLIIEDDEKTRSLMKRVIGKLGFETLDARDGRVGLDLFRKEKPKIVVTDLKMPDIDGLEVLHSIRKEKGATEVILVTAYGDYDTAIQALRDGAADYLKKPVDLDSLEAALNRCRDRLVETEKICIKPSIIVVEDDTVALEKLAGVFSKEDWDVCAAASGAEALAVFDERKIDVVLTDLRMPGMDGVELLREVKRRTSDCEVILISGYGDEASAVAAMKEGALNYIKKPIDLEQVLLAGEKALEKLALRRSMLYRTRELELAREIILKITRDGQVQVDVRNQKRSPTRDYARKLLESLPVGIMVVGPEMNVFYASPYMSGMLGFAPSALDEKTVESFVGLGLEGLTIDRLQQTVQRLFGKEPPNDETVVIGDCACIYATTLTILGETKTDNAVVLVIPGPGREKNN
ncbi:response regulator [Verrucomicrobiota bacterium]